MKPPRTLAWLTMTAFVGGLVPIPSAFADQPPAAAPQAPAPPSAPGAPAAPTAPAAAPSPPAAPAPLAEALPPDARKAYEEARMLLVDSDYAGALVKFTRAYDLFKEARLLWNMAACEKQLRHYSKAMVLLQRYLVEGGATLTPQDRADASELIQTLEPFTAKVLITSNEEGVAVTLDTERVGTTPLAAPIVVDIGSHRVVGTKDGFSEGTKDVLVTGRDAVSAILTLKKIVHEGRVAIMTAGATDAIYVDGRLVGTHEYAGALASGGHNVRVEATGMRTYEMDVSLADGESRNLNVTLTAEAKPSSGGIPGWLIVTGIGAVVAAGAVVGGYFLFKPSDGTAPIGTMSPGTVTVQWWR